MQKKTDSDEDEKRSFISSKKKEQRRGNGRKEPPEEKEEQSEAATTKKERGGVHREELCTQHEMVFQSRSDGRSRLEKKKIDRTDGNSSLPAGVMRRRGVLSCKNPSEPISS